MTKLKAAIVGPCLGVGGADALATGLIRYAINIEWTGVTSYHTTWPIQHDWATASMGKPVPIHEMIGESCPHLDGINYHDTFEEAAVAACKEADIVITWCVNDIGAIKARLPDIPIVNLIQNSDDYANQQSGKNLESIDFFVACSNAAAQVLPDGLPEEKQASIIYNGIDPCRVFPRYGRVAQRANWEVSDEQKVLLFIGRFVEEKNPSSLIMALSGLPDNWVGRYVGRGYKQKSLEQQGIAYAGGRVQFGDYVYHIGDTLAAADVVIYTSDFEGDSLGIREAHLAGTPVVTTEVGSVPELHEMFGPLSVTVPVSPSREDMIKAVQIADSQKNRETVVPLARQVAWNQFSLPAIAATWEEYLHSRVWHHRYKRRHGSTKIFTNRQPLSSPEVDARGTPL